MTETKTIKFTKASGTEGSLRVDFSQNNDGSWSLVANQSGKVISDLRAWDLFEALCLLRRKLAGEETLLLCAGARIDVFPSGMSRDMGGGRKAYVQRMGQPALMKDLVDIFDPAALNLIGSVEEQERYHAAWIESVTQR